MKNILLTFLLGTVMFLGLPWIAWGIVDLDLFFANPSRFAFTVFVILLNLFASIRLPEVGKEKPREKTVVARQNIAVVLMQVLSILLVVVAPWSDKHDVGVFSQSGWIRWTGLALYAAGYLIMHFTEAYLGTQFSVKVALQEGHRLVTTGPYAVIRHPRYLGVLIFLTGISLVFRSWAGLIGVAGMVAVITWRIVDEEAMMKEEFGAAWDDYAGRTRRMIPGVL